MSKLSNVSMVVSTFNLVESLNKKNNKLTTDFIFNFIEQYVAKKHSNGIYFWLPFGIILKKYIEKHIIKKQIELNGEEVQSNSLALMKTFEKSNRVNLFGKEMFSMDGRDSKKYILCPTNEEIFMEIFGKNKRSYKYFPKYFFQISTKYRDEIRPRNSILRTKEFFMKDGYYFCTSQEELKNFYKKIRNSYEEIFNFFNINFKIVCANSTQMLGDESEEFISESIVKETEINTNNNDVIEGLEIGHIFNLGTKYSTVCGGSFLDKKNTLQPIFFGSYGIGINRVIFKIVENMLINNYFCKLFNYAIISRNDNDLLSNIYKKLNGSFKDYVLHDIAYQNNYQDRIDNAKILGIENIFIEKEYSFYLLDAKNNNRYQVYEEDILSIMIGKKI